MTSTTQEAKETIDKSDVIKIKVFYVSDAIIFTGKQRRQPIEWEKICTNHTSYKGFLYRMI